MLAARSRDTAGLELKADEVAHTASEAQRVENVQRACGGPHPGCEAMVAAVSTDPVPQLLRGCGTGEQLEMETEWRLCQGIGWTP